MRCVSKPICHWSFDILISSRGPGLCEFVDPIVHHDPRIHTKEMENER
jgi:hypothetical protein